MTTKTSLNAIRQLVGKKDSCVIRKEADMMLRLLPADTRNFSKGIHDSLNDLTYGYCRKLGGLVLGYEQIKLINKNGLIDADDPHIHVKIRAIFYVFAPEVGLTIKSIFQDCAYNQAANFLVFNKYNVTFRSWDYSPENASGIMDKLRETKPNEEVTLKLTEVGLRDFLPYLSGYPVYENMALPTIATPASRKVCFDEDNLSTDLEESYNRATSEKHKKKNNNSINLHQLFSDASDDENIKDEPFSPEPEVKQELFSPKKKKKEKRLVCLSDEDETPKKKKKKSKKISADLSDDEVKEELFSPTDDDAAPRKKKKKQLVCLSDEDEAPKQKKKKSKKISDDEVKQEIFSANDDDAASKKKKKKEKQLVCLSDEDETPKMKKKKHSKKISVDLSDDECTDKISSKKRKRNESINSIPEKKSKKRKRDELIADTPHVISSQDFDNCDDFFV